jgi:hypothetical protein
MDECVYVVIDDRDSCVHATKFGVYFLGFKMTPFCEHGSQPRAVLSSTPVYYSPMMSPLEKEEGQFILPSPRFPVVT